MIFKLHWSLSQKWGTSGPLWNGWLSRYNYSDQKVTNQLDDFGSNISTRKHNFNAIARMGHNICPVAIGNTSARLGPVGNRYRRDITSIRYTHTSWKTHHFIYQQLPYYQIFLELFWTIISDIHIMSITWTILRTSLLSRTRPLSLRPRQDDPVKNSEEKGLLRWGDRRWGFSG